MIVEFLKSLFQAPITKPTPDVVYKDDSSVNDYLEAKISQWIYTCDLPVRLVKQDDLRRSGIEDMIPVYNMGDVTVVRSIQPIIDTIRPYGMSISATTSVDHINVKSNIVVRQGKHSVTLSRSYMHGHSASCYIAKRNESSVSPLGQVSLYRTNGKNESQLVRVGVAAACRSHNISICRSCVPDPVMDLLNFDSDYSDLVPSSHIDPRMAYMVMNYFADRLVDHNKPRGIGIEHIIRGTAKNRPTMQRSLKIIDDATKLFKIDQQKILDIAIVADTATLGRDLKFMYTAYNRQQLESVLNLYKINQIMSS